MRIAAKRLRYTMQALAPLSPDELAEPVRAARHCQTRLGNIHDGPTPGGDSHLFLALRVAAFEDLERFKTRVDGIIRQLRQGRPAPHTYTTLTNGTVARNT